MKKNLIFLLGIFLFSISYSQNFNYDIKYHQLDLEVDPAVHFIKGKVTTYFSPINNSMSEISFDFMNQMQVDSIYFQNKKISFTHTNEIVTANLGTSLSVGVLDSISVFYQGSPPTVNGFGAFVTKSHNGTPIMWTLSEPFGAKSWWPCKIELNDKADSIELIITAPSQYSVASNGLITKVETIGELKKTVWKHRYPITAYLVAFAVTNYSAYYDYVNIGDTINLPILEMVYPEDLASIQNQSPDVKDVLLFYCDSFMLYPFWREKYGQAQFNWGGGMEHQTMTFLYNFDHDLMAHELAHQWFGNYITCGSWHDIWLNEGFAVYLEGLTAEQGLAPYSWESWKTNTISYATSQPDGSVYVEDTTDVGRIFNYRLTYMKGGAILHMLRWVIGDNAFFEGIRNYLLDENLSFNYAQIDDLKQHLETVADTSLTEYFNDWYYSEGFPLYTIKWYQDENLTVSVDISQAKSVSNAPFFEMILPIKFIGKNEGEIKNVKINNTKQNDIFVFNLDFIVSNILFDSEKWILTRNTNIIQLTDTSEFKVKLSPNPVNDMLNIYLPIIVFIKSIEVFDTGGKIIIRKEINKKETSYNLSTEKLKKGTYILRINSDTKIFNQKFIKL